MVLGGCGGSDGNIEPDAMPPATTPPPSAGHELVYDDALGVVLS